MAADRPLGSVPLDAYRYQQVGPVELFVGDAAQVLAAMPDHSVDCLVTSPPFWSLRDYGTGRWRGGAAGCPHPVPAHRRTDGTVCGVCGAVWADPQYGLEPTVEQYIARLVGVFDQASRVLTPSGTAWLNLGDSYAGGAKRAYDTGSGLSPTRALPPVRAGSVLPAKNLIGVPWRVAFALQATGKWFLRNAVVWSKTNPMPESVRDRLSATYEMLFLLTRSERYFFDLDPIREPLNHPHAADGTRVFGGVHKGHISGVEATRRRRGSRYGAGKYTAEQVVVEPGAGRGNLVATGQAHTAAHPRGRNPGDVWRLSTRPYRGSHVAPFPIDLPIRAIAAGCPPGGMVLDPFSGAGTTGLAALQLGRAYLGVDSESRFHDEALERMRPHLPDDGTCRDPDSRGGGG
jgi:DNA modification methylase